MWWSVFNFSEIWIKIILHKVFLGIFVNNILTVTFFYFDSTKILSRSVGNILNFVIFLEFILKVFSHIEQTTSDDPCMV